MAGRSRPRGAYPSLATRSAPARPLTPAEARADALLSQIPDDEMDAFARAVARVLLSAARNRERPPRPAQKSAARG
jgi:hypothetical protein